MSRRPCGRRSRGAFRAGNPDPFLTLAASYAWRADDAVDNGSVTTSLPNYLGPTLALPRQGAAGQAIKAASANLGGRQSIAFAPAGLGYGNVVAFGGVAPAACTFATVARMAITNVGLVAVTVGGTVNTGFAQLHLTHAESRKLTNGITQAAAVPVNAVFVSVFTGTTITTYLNTKTGTSGAVGGALAGTSIHLGALNSTNIFTLQGEWATSAVWDRALTNAEVGALIDHLGAHYGIAIAA